MHVPRETSSNPAHDKLDQPGVVPSAAAQVFGARLDVAVAYAHLLSTDGVARGLLGPREAPRIWSRHLLNCAVLVTEIPDGATVCDIGSGAGLPGLVVAICRPDLAVTLVDPLLRRTAFLEAAVRALGLSQVRVVRDRAEHLHGSASFDVVTSRALAPLPRLLDWSMPLVRPGGVLLAMKGSSARAELEAARDDGSSWALERGEVRTLGAGLIDPPATVIRLQN